MAVHQYVSIDPASTLETGGDIASLVTARPLEPQVHMPDLALARGVNLPTHLDAIVSSAREAASQLYAG